MSREGLFVVLDGPSGVGKSTVARLLTERLTAAGHRCVATKEPSAGPIGELARSGTHRFNGLTLACLVAADRYHHLATEIRPALAAGYVVVCDRYLPSSLVLQRLDGVSAADVWSLNAHVEPPDLTIILSGDPQMCGRHAAQRGTYSRFHGGLAGEADAYRDVASVLALAGYPTITHAIGQDSPERVANALTERVLTLCAP